MRLLGATGIVYTLILTALGFTQTSLLEGPMHWLIQTAHVLIGFGALALVQVIGKWAVSMQTERFGKPISALQRKWFGQRLNNASMSNSPGQMEWPTMTASPSGSRTKCSFPFPKG